MGSYNKVLLVGNLTRDPDMKYVKDDIPVSNYSIAVNRNYKNSLGERTPDFFKIVCWRKLAELSGKYLKKGDPVLIDGRLQTRTYDKEGQIHYVTEINAQNIQFLSRKRGTEDFTGLDNESFNTGELKLEEVPF